jgi:hypothetical protein
MTTPTSPKPTVEVKNGVAVDFQETEETGDEGNQCFSRSYYREAFCSLRASEPHQSPQAEYATPFSLSI